MCVGHEQKSYFKAQSQIRHVKFLVTITRLVDIKPFWTILVYFLTVYIYTYTNLLTQFCLRHFVWFFTAFYIIRIDSLHRVKTVLSEFYYAI